LYGEDPTVAGLGIAGSNTRLLEIIDTTNSRVVLPRASGTLAVNNTSSSTVLQDGKLSFDGAAQTVGIYTCGAKFADGIKIVAGPGLTGWKQIIGFDQSNFAISFLKAAGTNRLVFDVPTGNDDADTLRFSFSEDGVSFATSVGLTAGVGNFTQVNTGTGNFSSVAVGSELKVTDDSVYYCASPTATENWLLTKYRLVLGPNLAGNQRLELNNEEGLVFYCGAGGTINGVVNGNLYAQYTSNGTQSATIVSDTLGAHFKIDGGAELVLNGGPGFLGYVISNNFRFIQEASATNFININTTSNAMEFYTSSAKTFSISSGSFIDYSFTVGTGAVNPSIAFDNSLGTKRIRVTANSFAVVDPDDPLNGYTTISYPTVAQPSGGIAVFCGPGGAGQGAYYYNSFVQFRVAGVNKLSITADDIGMDGGARTTYSGISAGGKNILTSADDFRVIDPDDPGDYVSITPVKELPSVNFYTESTLRAFINYSKTYDALYFGLYDGTSITLSTTGEYTMIRLAAAEGRLTSLKIVVDYLPEYTDGIAPNQVSYKNLADIILGDKVLVWNG
jgi:hypothetical protein